MEGNHVIFGVCCGSSRMIVHHILMLTSYFHVPILTSQVKPKEGPSSIRPMIANVEAREAACSVRWARALTILFRNSWQDGLEVRLRSRLV